MANALAAAPLTALSTCPRTPASSRPQLGSPLKHSSSERSSGSASGATDPGGIGSSPDASLRLAMSSMRIVYASSSMDLACARAPDCDSCAAEFRIAHRRSASGSASFSARYRARLASSLSGNCSSSSVGWFMSLRRCSSSVRSRMRRTTSSSSSSARAVAAVRVTVSPLNPSRYIAFQDEPSELATRLKVCDASSSSWDMADKPGPASPACVMFILARAIQCESVSIVDVTVPFNLFFSSSSSFTAGKHSDASMPCKSESSYLATQSRSSVATP
mmetsp:Transcript_5471/g.24591  ORF Transcript_5471/g.24591 Transcript_5471/m.24591 type:complete len:275 (+) Transcript_5471:1435-2259(+)